MGLVGCSDPRLLSQEEYLIEDNARIDIRAKTTLGTGINAIYISDIMETLA